MKATQYLTVLFLILCTGCAALGLDGEPTEQEQYENDPVAQAALKMRDGSRAPASLSNIAPSSARARTDELVVGMSMSGVRTIWGNPQDVETAGDNRLGNERWIYYNGITASSLAGKRAVYFERGQVVGWETLRSE